MNRTLVAALLMLPLAAFAQANTERLAKINAQLEQRFGAADANGDGQLTRDEAKGKMPKVYENFDTIDAEHKGFVSLEQIRRFAASQVAARRGGQQ